MRYVVIERGDVLTEQCAEDRQGREHVTVGPTVAVEPARVAPLRPQGAILSRLLDRPVKFRSNGAMDWPLQFGIFMAPFHPPGQNPTLALDRDLDLIVHLDRLGFDEAWIGEHHSGGYEIIASPELFIAVAAERTKHIRLGTGVVSLPYHQPLMVAQRLVLLDHLTKGRVMLGVGPGALPSDAFMLGIDPAVQRDRMEESLSIILQLLRTDEPVTHHSDWFTLENARLHLLPYSKPHPEVAVAAMISPSGPRAAGQVRLRVVVDRRDPARRHRPARPALAGV